MPWRRKGGGGIDPLFLTTAPDAGEWTYYSYYSKEGHRRFCCKYSNMPSDTGVSNVAIERAAVQLHAPEVPGLNMGGGPTILAKNFRALL
jgi:hypothetical protein